MMKKVSEIETGDTITNVGYVFSIEQNSGYLSYPMNEGGMNAAMPDNTYLIVLHDNMGEEVYLLADGDSEFMVRG